MSDDLADWKSRCLRFAQALVDIMDGVQDHEINDQTGLPIRRCNIIAEARRDAIAFLEDVK